MSAENPNNFYISSLSKDNLKPIIDVKNTTVDAFIRMMAVKFYKSDKLKNTKIFQGVVLRVVEDPKLFDVNAYNFINSVVNTNNKRYKVWIPDLNSILSTEMPSDDTLQGKTIISSLPDFIVTDATIGELKPADLVKVSFHDLTNFKNGFILEKINRTPTGEGGTPDNPPRPSGAFPTGQAPPREEVSYDANGIPKDLTLNPTFNGWRKMINVKKGNKCVGDPIKYKEIMDQFMVHVNPRYKKSFTPQRPNGITYCNMFVYDVCCAYDAVFPYFTLNGNTINDPAVYTSGYGVPKILKYATGNEARQPGKVFESFANGNYRWLKANYDSAGWRKITAEEAQERANAGFLTIGIIDGHTWVVRPSPDGKFNSIHGVYISQAGGSNYTGVYSDMGDRRWKRYDYYTVKDC